MLSIKHLFIATALFEIGGGTVLLILPALAIGILFGVEAPAPEALVVGRVGGVALLAIGAACWLARNDPNSGSRRGLVWGALTYNSGATAVLAITGLAGQLVGFLLWPAIILHVVMAVWCAASLRCSPV